MARAGRGLRGVVGAGLKGGGAYNGGHGLRGMVGVGLKGAGLTMVGVAWSLFKGRGLQWWAWPGHGLRGVGGAGLKGAGRTMVGVVLGGMAAVGVA